MESLSDGVFVQIFPAQLIKINRIFIEVFTTEFVKIDAARNLSQLLIRNGIFVEIFTAQFVKINKMKRKARKNGSRW
ncbi:MAG: hypothetical protein AAF722_02090 [Cyanobacteria bacterium P01_C01_bin.70]